MIRELVNEKRASMGMDKVPTGMPGSDLGPRKKQRMNVRGWKVVSRRRGLVEIRKGSRTITMIEREYDAALGDQ
jgi:hypothetical protein